MSTLAGSFPKSSPGLPRGRSRLDPANATAQQRARLMRAVIASVADKGYQATTVGDIVESARVSRSVLYREFGGKLECFLAAIEAGRQQVTERIVSAMEAAQNGSLETVLRAMVRAYLETCSSEPAHTRAWVLELSAAGPKGVEARDRYLDGFAALFATVDIRHSGGRARAPEHYTALVGGVAELVSREVRAGGPESLLHLEDAITLSATSMLRDCQDSARTL